MRIDLKHLASVIVDLSENEGSARQAEIIDAALTLLQKNGQSNAMRDLPRLVKRAWYRHHQVTPVTLTTPTVEKTEGTSDIAQVLERLLKGNVELDERSDPSMIGGATISIGDERFDLSLRSSLAQLSNHLTTHYSLPTTHSS